MALKSSFRFVWQACVLGIAFLFSAGAALAIPSPELVIGSVSSLSQVFGIALATITGSSAYFARRLGIKPSEKTSAYTKYAPFFLGVICVVLTVSLFLQYKFHKTAELNRLQQTLIRPAQFDGTEIRDASLVETSFDSQQDHPLAISTTAAAALLGASDEAIFLDIRESGENEMGTLPGASHTRFPDISPLGGDFDGQTVILFCHNGNRSSETCEKLAALGIDCKFIAGGIEKWLVEGRQLSDTTIENLSDLRALPKFENDSTLIGTPEFSKLYDNDDLQILDVRYPGDFQSGHLPGAVNVPIRALPTAQLSDQISQLVNTPTVVACYDRRSCFMGQVLAYELSKAGIPFLGRYTTPWEFYIPAPTKPHVEAWLLQQNQTLWDRGIGLLASALARIASSSHLAFAILGLAVVSRLLVLPITLKSERDQIVTSQHKDEFAAVKLNLKSDPARKARAIRDFYDAHNITPGRNLLGLLFLPLMMLGLSAVEQSTQLSPSTFFKLDLAAADPTFILPAVFSICAGLYLQWVAGKTRKQSLLWFAISTPLIFLLGVQLSAAGALYLTISIALLLVQRSVISGNVGQLFDRIRRSFRTTRRPPAIRGLHFLDEPEALVNAGNKSLRLAIMKRDGLPVPTGVVLSPELIDSYSRNSGVQKEWTADLIWQSIGKVACAVRSSSAAEDGAENSFAGVFDSVLDVDRTSLCDAIDRVIASYSGNRVASYSSDQSHEFEASILIQKMIDAEYSGVMFTQDPSALGLQMVEYVEGCGENLVSGNLTPTTIQFGRFSLQQVDDQKAAIDLLPLLRLGQRIETLFGTPQDIEWAYTNGEFHILQSRDITALQNNTAQTSATQSELGKHYNRYKDRSPNEIILEQDELSEVLPHPTLASFDLMARLWSPGGSLDLACRRLGVPYNLPEGQPGHLVSVFGRTYVDTMLKEKTTLHVGRMKAKQLRKMAVRVRQEFQETSMQDIQKFASRLQATDFDRLPYVQLLEVTDEIVTTFTQEAYVEAEVINVLAGFLFSEAYSTTADTPGDRRRLMSPVLPNAPSQRIVSCQSDDKALEQQALIDAMGHRSSIDYELSAPRYQEDPTSLTAIAVGVGHKVGKPLSLDQNDVVSMAIAFQDLKEQAKHETLRLVHQLRRALLAISRQTSLGDLVFHATINEILQLPQTPSKNFITDLSVRKQNRETLLNTSLPGPRLTLPDLELLSSPGLKTNLAPGEMAGTCVSGAGQTTGTVFKVNPSKSLEMTFDGFRAGDIIVCSVIDPNWLPYVQKAGGVVAEVGGWLSHMAIIARESGVMMLVKCNGIMGLETGGTVTLSDCGSITIGADELPLEAASG